MLTTAYLTPVAGIYLLHMSGKFTYNIDKCNQKWKKEISKFIVMWTTMANDYWWFTHIGTAHVVCWLSYTKHSCDVIHKG